MKFTEKQRARLKALLAKGDGITDKEAKELRTLQIAAKGAGVDPETGEDKPAAGDDAGDAGDDAGDAGDAGGDDDAKGLSEADARKLVADSVTKSFTDLGLDADTVKSLKTRLDGANSLSPDAIQAAIKEVLGGDGVDLKALQESVKKSLGNEVLTKDGVKKILEDWGKEQRTGSKMLFPADAAFPVEHRKGNMSVGQKQLLNVLMMHVSEEALASSNGGQGVARPKNINDGITAEQLRNAERIGEARAKAVRQEVVYGQKAITTSGAGSGLELINTDLSSDIQARMYMESLVAAQFVSSEIQMPSNPFQLPLTTTRPTFYKGSETVAATESNPGTSNIVLTAQKLIGYCQYSYEADEDAVVAVLPWIQEQLGKGAADGLEDALINGDTTATHMDSDTHAISGAAAKLFKGLRYYAKSVTALKVSFATGGITAANVGALRKAMGKYGMKPSDLMLICGTSGYNDLALLSETLTAEKVGGAARILTGNAPQLFGIPIIPSSKCREDLNASGVYDGTTTTKGSILLVNKTAWFVGVKRGFTLEVDVNKVSQVNQVIASFRRAFMPRETPSATEQTVVMAYNYNA